MPCEVDKNINFILNNLRGNLFSRFARNVTETVDDRRELLGYMVSGVVGIDINLKVRLIVIREEMRTEKRHHVKAHVWGNVADTNLFMAGMFLATVTVARDVGK